MHLLLIYAHDSTFLLVAPSQVLHLALIVPEKKKRKTANVKCVENL